MRRSNLAHVEHIDVIRKEATEKLDPKRRGALGQFMTPSPIADFMAGMFEHWPAEIEVLDPGAGVGSLTEAFLKRAFEKVPDANVTTRAYEIEPVLLSYLAGRLGSLEGISAEVVERDFIQEGAFALSFGRGVYTHAILNPPYKKIASDSEYRLLLRRFGIETVNLYTAFLGLAIALTKHGGEIVAIIPRSFCNGLYFRPFREWLLKEAAIKHVHVFESRTKAFLDDEVLQENIIIHLERGATQGPVKISTSHDPTFSDYLERSVPFEEIVYPKDDERYIHIPTTILERTDTLFTHTLAELELQVSTGPVVDFRLRDHWLMGPEEGCAPLLYAHHFNGAFQWPKEHKKPNAVRVNADTTKWLLPAGCYAVTKRFSSKEERRRLVAYVVNPKKLSSEWYGFENHLNVFHWKKRGIDPVIAQGLALFLNATVTDLHFRNFSGHTQVNATDLRSMRYPSRELLSTFGRWAASHPGASQEEMDAFVRGPHGNDTRPAR